MVMSTACETERPSFTLQTRAACGTQQKERGACDGREEDVPIPLRLT